MKIQLICVVLLAGILGANAQNNTKETMDTNRMDALNSCKKSVDGLAEDVEKVLEEIRVPKTKEASCVIGCYLKKLSAITADNKLNSLKTQQLLVQATHISTSVAERMIGICKGEVEKKSSTECDAALALMTCLNNGMKKITPDN